MTDQQALLIEFINWLATKEIKLIHTPSLTSPTDKGTTALAENFLEQKGD